MFHACMGGSGGPTEPTAVLGRVWRAVCQALLSPLSPPSHGWSMQQRMCAAATSLTDPSFAPVPRGFSCTSSRLARRACAACVSALSPHAPCAYLPALSRCGRFGRPPEHGSASSGQWWHRMLPSSQARRGSVRLRLLDAQPAPLGGIGPTMHTAPASQVRVRRRRAAEGTASLDRSVNAQSDARRLQRK